MNTAKVRNAYAQSESQAKIHPVKLIYMMYERLLVHLEYTKDAIEKKDLQKRGEHLGKAIAILTELNASIKEDDESDSANFLRGLYGAILMEIPRVAMDNDVAILKQSMLYISRLKEIWEETAMREHDLLSKEVVEVVKPSSPVSEYRGEQKSVMSGVSVSI
ncbi:MAG: flagellar export chaperone FliS [Spirochaetales bacterium]|jgi:flagellar protein FliS|nr:flagellar export chaperone FliS [Spirochaetales bacterium]